MVLQPKDDSYLNDLFIWFCTKLNDLYQGYMDINELDSRYSIGLPVTQSEIKKELNQIM